MQIIIEKPHKYFFLFLFFIFSAPSLLASPSTSILLNAEEAKKFCIEIWFPKLRLGSSSLSEKQLTQKLEELLSLYTEDSEFIDPNNEEYFSTKVLRGKEQIKRYYKSILTHYPLWEFSILAIYPTSTGFILRYEGRNAPPVQKFEGVDIVELKNLNGKWKISKLIGYYDRKPFSQ